MYKRGKAFQHSTYIRPDKKESMKLAKRIAEENNQSFSRFITDVVHDFITGRLHLVKGSKIRKVS